MMDELEGMTPAEQAELKVKLREAADALAFGRQGGDLPTEREGGPDQIGVAQRSAFLVLQDRLLGAIGLAGVHQGVEQAGVRLPGVKRT